MKNKLLIIQPQLSQYRLPIYEELSIFYEVHILSDSISISLGFGNSKLTNTKIKQHIITPITEFMNGKIIYQKNLIKHIREIKPDKIYTYANPHCVSYWILLIYCLFTKIPIYSHSQGPYNKSKSLKYKILYFLLAKLSTKVFLYVPYSLQKIEELGLSKNKFQVIHNSIVNNYSILPVFKSYSKTEVLFIGRLREGCNIDLLCDAIIELKNRGIYVKCHIIGSGVLKEFYIEKYKNCNLVRFYGQVYEQDRISEISKNCIIGCYPGNAGLSVVHYMSLSLPCLVHNNLSKHQGPEPSYIIDKYNGRLFQYGDKENFSLVFTEMLNETDLQYYGNNAYKTYIELTEPSYAQRIINALED
ncbi:hypothetical protein EZS27_024793 [termite gut metagenome]|uniref:Glycosyl transferase family 1 domain-containing protein n=1 Tax=termite gut metagenome TaxID=433724 RepID=A0A5J4QVT9_9ZZZZ